MLYDRIFLLLMVNGFNSKGECKTMYHTWQGIWFVTLWVIIMIWIALIGAYLIGACRQDGLSSLLITATGSVVIFDRNFIFRRLYITFVDGLRYFRMIKKSSAYHKVWLSNSKQIIITCLDQPWVTAFIRILLKYSCGVFFVYWGHRTWGRRLFISWIWA